MGCAGCPNCNTCPNCCVTSVPCPGGTWCAGFFDQVLDALSAPSPGAHNRANLLLWSSYEGTRAGWNPLATTLVSGTYSWWNCAPHYVKCYASEADGVTATADTLRLPYYPAILAALHADAPLCAWAAGSIPAEIDTWGTSGFATHLRSLTPCSTQCPGCAPCTHCTNPAVGCVPLVCGPCEVCSEGVCFSTCAPGEVCVGGACTGSTSPPPAGAGAPLAALLLLGGMAGLGVWSARRRPGTRRALVARLQGGEAAFGERH